MASSIILPEELIQRSRKWLTQIKLRHSNYSVLGHIAWNWGKRERSLLQLKQVIGGVPQSPNPSCSMSIPLSYFAASKFLALEIRVGLVRWLSRQKYLLLRVTT